MQKPSTKPSIDDQDSRLFDEIVHSVVSYLEHNGFSSIRATTDDFPTPSRIRWDESDDGVVPHITCEYAGFPYVFEIETGTDINRDEVEDRWRLFSVFARRHQGKFYLVIPESREDYLRRVVSELGVNTRFLKLSGIG